MTRDERWLAAQLPFVRRHLPDPPARVLEVGCGPLGGFVPALRAAGYEAVGVDPRAPEGNAFVSTEIERYLPGEAVDAVVASTSLHHVADLDDVLDRLAAALVPGGTVIVVEWAHERFDEATARWAFDRLGDGDGENGWVQRRRDEWRRSRRPWEPYFRAWSAGERLHAGQAVLDGLEARFELRLVEEGPYLFPDLAATTTAADEEAAIAAGRIRPLGLRAVGVDRGAPSWRPRASP